MIVKKHFNIIIIITLLIVSLFLGTAIDYIKGIYSKEIVKKVDFDEKVDFSERGINEDDSVYENDMPIELSSVYITVANESEGNTDIGLDKPLTFDILNGLRSRITLNSTLNFDAIFQEGNELGPQKGMFGYTDSVPNCTIELRGQSTIDAVQKSYKIRLYDDTGLWKDMKIINLNKHAWDMTRVRNKLSFDYFKIIPDMFSLRTNFVKVYVKDLSGGNKKAGFVEYGLFTQIEQPNKAFLSSHGLDPNGSLYKANNFEFFRYSNVILNQNDKNYNKTEFEKILEIKSTNNNEKLIEMLDAVNNYSKNINDIVDKHFDRANLFTWLAINILMGNIDTRTQNYLLYSPNNSDKWYLGPWDYDAAWDWENQTGVTPKLKASWEFGIANFWGSVLFNRLLKDTDNQKQLTDKIIEIGKIINKENTRKLIDSYYPLVSPIIAIPPDISGIQGSIENFKTEYRRLETIPDQNLKRFHESLEYPMPFYLGGIQNIKGQYSLHWEQSYDFQRDDIKYDLTLATDPDFKNVIINAPNLVSTVYKIKNITPGTYYWKVTVSDKKGNTQQAFDIYTDNFGKEYFGISQLIIN